MDVSQCTTCGCQYECESAHAEKMAQQNSINACILCEMQIEQHYHVCHICSEMVEFALKKD